jgi:hypothetical protein
MRFVSKNYQEQYNEQKNRGTFSVPPTGTYHVVNKTIQFVVFKTGSKCLRVISHVLGVVIAPDIEAAKKWIGKTFSQDLWWDLSKPRNQERVALMAIANGESGEWDSDSKADLIRVMTGVPYQLRCINKVNQYEGKDRLVLDVNATERLGKDIISRYSDDPDWRKTIGDPTVRFLDIKDSSGARSNGHQSTPEESDPFSGSDIPF